MTGVRRRRPWVVLAVLVGVVLLGVASWSLFRPKPGNKETDRIARVVSDAISYPRQSTAEGFARAAFETRAGQDGRLAIIGVDDEGAAAGSDPQKRIVRLTFRVTAGSESDALFAQGPVTACYHADFNRDGVIGGPHRTDCPANAPALTPSPGAAVGESSQLPGG